MIANYAWFVLEKIGLTDGFQELRSTLPSFCSAPSAPGQPQEQAPGDDPHAEVEIKPQLKPRVSVAKEEEPKPSHQL